MEVMTNDAFRETVRKWLNHKFILANQPTDRWYKEIHRAAALYKIRGAFSAFISFPVKYNLAQLAIHIKRNEECLQLILPIPQNPSYETACNTLNELLLKATEILKENNLLDLLNPQ